MLARAGRIADATADARSNAPRRAGAEHVLAPILPEAIRACLFDLDGVRAFLASPASSLSEGSPDDPPSTETIHGLGTPNNDRALDLIRHGGVEVYSESVRLVEAVRAAGLRRAVVSASKNCREVLLAAGIQHLFEVRVDAMFADQIGLLGEPAPDMFLAAAALGVDPARCAMFEDVIAGVQAGGAGAFGWVVGVDRIQQAEALRSHGADLVVDDLGEFLAG
jgi:HAD superfamily hydrolase (TIGR01509 family)